MARTVKKKALTLEAQPYPVPDNWVWTTVGILNDYAGNSVDPAKTPDEVFELYSVPSSADNYPEVLLGIEIGSTKQRVKKGDVLLCKINPRINRVWKVCQHTEHSLLASSEWIVARNGTTNCNYLMWCFKSEYFREYMLSNVSGVGGSLMRAQPKYVQTYPVPLPPLAEQQRIVDRIERLLSKLDAAKELAQSVLDSFEDRKTALLIDAFSGKITELWRREHGLNINSWKEHITNDLLNYVTSGSRGWAKYYADDGAIFFRMGNLDHGTIDLDLKDVRYVCILSKAERQRSRVQKGDILISITADVGMVGLALQLYNSKK